MKRTPLPQVTSCAGCGVCCTEQAGLPASWYCGGAGLGDPATLPPELRAELEAVVARWRETGAWPRDGDPCLWYDAAGRRCRHYEHRPQLCRDAVQVGDEACLRWRRTQGVDLQPRYRLVRGRLVKTIE